MNKPIAVEVSSLTAPNLTGVGFYIGGLLSALIRANPDIQFELYWFKDESTPTELLEYSNTTGKQLPIKRLTYKLLTVLGFAPRFDRLANTKATTFFFPSFANWPVSLEKKTILVIHDTATKDRPETIKTARQRFFIERSVFRSLESVSAIIANSESTKKSILKYYKVEPNKITVINPALNHQRFKPASKNEVSAIKQKFGITRNYLLYVGTLEPRKNIVGIIKAYASLPPPIRSKYQLVLAGGKGWGSDAIESAASRLQKSELIRTGYVGDSEMPALYTGATVFMFPSLFEGWGMPVLEAQACGVPVLTADNSSLPEAGGSAAEYVKTGSQRDLDTKLLSLLKSSSKRAKLSADGIKHASLFSWESSANKLLRLIQTLDN